VRFRRADRERIWQEYVSWLDDYRRRLDMDGIELYNGGTGGPSAPTETLRRFTRAMPGLRYILADLGCHTDTTPATANGLLDGAVVFHTLTNFRIWTTSEEVVQRKMDSENAWLVDEIKSHTPPTRPGFMSALAISWSYYPSWLKDLKDRLPPEYVVVSPGDLARLYRDSGGDRPTDAPRKGR